MKNQRKFFLIFLFFLFYIAPHFLSLEIYFSGDKNFNESKNLSDLDSILSFCNIFFFEQALT